MLIAGTEQTRAEHHFDPFRVGLDHLALALSAADLPGLKQRLDGAGVRNNGIEHDNQSKKICFASLFCVSDSKNLRVELS